MRFPSHRLIAFANSRFPLWMTLLAFALRLWRIDAQSLRGDEAFDALFAAQPIGVVLYQELYGQTYPPLYHLLEHFWLMLAGSPELSARFITFCAGVLLAPVVYRLARALFDEHVARLALVLVAAHPFLVWHSQDGRMYMLMGTLAALSALSAIRLWQQAPASIQRMSSPPVRAGSAPRSNAYRGADAKSSGEAAAPGAGAWLAYVAVTTLSLMNHYFAYLAVVALNVAALYLCWRRQWSWRFLLQWFAANGVIALLGALWLVPAWPHLAAHREPWIVPVTPADVFSRALLAYSLGTTVSWESAVPFLLLFVALLLAGILGARQSADHEGRVVASLNALVPIAAVYVGSLWRPIFDEKFLIFVVPFYILLVARGLRVVGESRRLTRLQPLFVAALLAGMMLSVGNYHFNPAYAKSPPWREAAQLVRLQASDGDVLVYNFPDPALPYQVGNALPLVLLPAQAQGDPATAKPLEGASVGPALERLSQQYNRIWFLPQPAPNWDPDASVARWLSRFAERATAASVGSLKVERYLTARTFAQHWTPLEAQFAGGITLVAYHIVPSAETVQLTLYWKAGATPPKDYTVFAHLLDNAGVLRAQQDNPPVNGTYPTGQWQLNTIIVDRYDIIIPSDVSGAHLRLEVGLYDASGARLRAGGDDKVIFGDVSR